MFFKKDTFIAFYDLESGCNSFNFYIFLTRALIERTKYSFSNLHIVFVPPNINGYPTGWTLFDQDQYESRLNQLLVPLALGFSESAGVTVLSKREEALRFFENCGKINCFPENYHPEHNSFMPVGLKHTESLVSPLIPRTDQALKWVSEWKSKIISKKQKLICINLRNTGYQSERESNLENWIRFARSLDEEKYKVVFIPDTNNCLSYDTRLHQYEVVPSASINIELRFAIYRNSHVVLGVNTGPLTLCHCNNIPCIIYNPCMATVGWDTFEEQEFLPGTEGQFQKSPHIKVIWEKDHEEVLKDSFTEYENQIDGKKSRFKEIHKLAKQAISKEDTLKSRLYSSLLLSFYPERYESWLIRIEVLLYNKCYRELFITTAGAKKIHQDILKKIFNSNAVIDNGIKSFLSFYIMNFPNWKQLCTINKSVIKNQRIIIFGTGKHAIHTYNLINSVTDIIGWCDNNPIKKGRTLNNKKIFSPHEIKNIEADLIIISSMYATDIYFQLIELGFANNKIKIFEN